MFRYLDLGSVARSNHRLTERQGEILAFIRKYGRAQGYPPTLREIGERFGIRSTNGVNDHLVALEKKGVLSRGGMKSRALRILTPPVAAASDGPVSRDFVEVPLVGRVAAGQPILAAENVEDTLRVDRALAGARAVGAVFALRVRGDSMIDAGIRDGDMLFVRKQDAASPGDVVVALLGDEATVKRFERSESGVKLVPANAAMQPIVVEGDRLADLRIVGVAVGVYRRL